MATWEVVVGSATYPLSDRAPFDLVSAAGVGLSPVRRLTQRGPLQHGDTDLGFRLDSRLVSLVLLAQGDVLADLDTARDAVAWMFGPRSADPLALRVTRDDGAVRHLDCYTVGLLDLPVTDDDRYGPRQKFGVQLQAADPNWYDPETRQVSFGLAAMSSGLLVPVAVPVLLATGTGGDGNVQVDYVGTFDEYPLILLTGPIDDAYLENVTTGDLLSFDGFTLAAGKTLSIDLRYGRKTVIDSDGTNQIGALTATSDLATWHLAGTLEAPVGYNELRLSGTALSAASGVSITYHNRYISL